MLRKLLGAGVLLATLAGCTELEGKTCTQDSDCAAEGQVCNTSLGRCFKEPEIPSTECTPACADYQACTATGCKARFTELKILTPAANAVVSGGTVQVQAQLKVDPAYVGTTTYPDTLMFSATRGDGLPGVGSFGAVTRTDNTYTVDWTPPTGQTQVTLTAAHPTPAAVQSGSVTVTLDTVAPTFTITFSNPPTRATGSTTQADERDSFPGFDMAFRRDESVTVTVSADEAVTDATLTVSGIGPGGSVGASLAPVTLATSTACAGSPPFCGTTVVNLSSPEMRDIRGSMGFRVDGKDAANNSGTQTASLKVTRWKWAFDAAAPVKASPALGEKGSVYFGTASASGKVFRLEPDGRKLWDVDVESVDSSPAVGAFNNGTELVYVASNFTGLTTIGSGTRLRAINGTTGVVLNTPCTFSVLSGTPPSVVSAAAITNTTISSTPVETGLFVVSGGYGSAVGLRPTSATASTVGCVNSDSSQGMPDATANGGLVVANAAQFVYPTDTRRIVKYAFGGTAPLWTANPGGGAGQRVFGMAMLGNNVLASGGSDFDQGGLFQVAFDVTGTPTIDPLAGTENGRIYQIAVSAENMAYYGREFTGPSTQLAKYNLAGPSVALSSNATGVIAAAPVLGSDGKLYTINRSGELAVWSSSDLTSLWKLPNVGSVDASPTLDCSRGGDGTPRGASAPGVLYVAAGNKLNAFIVDSPRMTKDANSWPKFQHDARNTGNPATPITNCP